MGRASPPGQGDGQRPGPGEEALQGDDLVGALGGDHPGAVVLKAPAHRRQEDQQGAGGKAQAVRALEGQQGAGQGDEPDGRPQPAGHRLVKDKQGNDGGGRNLKVAQQGGAGGGAGPYAQHQEDGRGDVQRDHARHKGQVPFGKRAGAAAVLPAEQGEDSNANPRAQVQ